MIVNIVIFAAVVIFLMASAGAAYSVHLDRRLKHVDELVARGVPVDQAVVVAYRL